MNPNTAETRKPSMPSPEKCGWCRAAAQIAVVGRSSFACNACVSDLVSSELRFGEQLTLFRLPTLSDGPEPAVGRRILIAHTRYSHGAVYSGIITAVEDNRRGDVPDWYVDFEHDDESPVKTGTPGRYKQQTDGGVMLIQEV